MKNDYEVRAEKFIDQFHSYIDNCESLSDIRRAVIRFNREHHRKVKFAHGLTRVAFITSDYVVKFDFGYAEDKRTFGSCYDEVDVYDLAVEAGMDYLFAKPTLVTMFGKTFCIMPRIYGIGKRTNDVDWYLTSEEVDWVYKYVCDIHNQNYGWKNGRPIIFDYACRIQSRRAGTKWGLFHFAVEIIFIKPFSKHKSHRGTFFGIIAEKQFPPKPKSSKEGKVTHCLFSL